MVIGRCTLPACTLPVHQALPSSAPSVHRPAGGAGHAPRDRLPLSCSSNRGYPPAPPVDLALHVPGEVSGVDRHAGHRQAGVGLGKPALQGHPHGVVAGVADDLIGISDGGSRQQRLSDIAVAPRPRQPDVADAERVAQVEQRHLNRSAATSTPAEHVLDLSVGFRPLPQTTRSRVSCRAPGRRHPADAGTARASGPSRTIRPGRAGTFKMYKDRLPVGRSWCARCGAHQADKLALDNTPVCARCWLPTDEQAANSPPTSSEGINLRLPTAAHLRRGKP